MEKLFNNFETELFPLFSSYLRRLGRSENTINFYHQYITNFVKFTGLEKSDLQNRRNFEEKYRKLWDRNITNNTRKKYLQAMQRFTNFVIDQELDNLENTIINRIKPPRIQPKITPAMEISDIKKIFLIAEKLWHGSIRERNMMILKLFLHAGLRRGELLNLERSDIGKNFIFVKNGKGGKSRIVYIPEFFSAELHHFLAKYPHKNAVFQNTFGKKISLMVIRRLFEEINKFLDFHIHPHKLRHEYATRLLEIVKNPAIVRDQMGHTDITTTNKYLASRDSKRLAEIQKFDYKD